MTSRTSSTRLCTSFRTYTSRVSDASELGGTVPDPNRPSDTPADATRDATRDEPVGTGGKCSWSASSCAVTVRVLLREPGLCCSGGTGIGGGASVELRLRGPARRRSDRERARTRCFRAVSPSDSVSVDAGEGESSSISRSSSVQVCWPAAATRESGLGAAESDARGNVCVVGDTAEGERRELMSMSLSLLLESESSSVPSPTWRKLAEVALSLGVRGDVDTEGRRNAVEPRDRFGRNVAFEGRCENRDDERGEVVDEVLNADWGLRFTCVVLETRWGDGKFDAGADET